MRNRRLLLTAFGLSFCLFANTLSFAEAPAGGEEAQQEAVQEAGPVIAEDGTVQVTVQEIQKYGNLVLAIPGSTFMGLGYEYGDIVSVNLAGQTLSMPVGSDYSDVDNGSYVCRVEKTDDPSQSRVILAINMGDLATSLGIASKAATEGDPGYIWTYNPGFDASMPVTVSMQEKGGYADQYMMHQLQRSNDRAAYPGLTDAQYANFRAIATTGMGENVLFRSSSPVNPEISRNAQADAAVRENGIRTVLNLADSRETMQSYEGYGSTYYAGLNVLPLNLGVDFKAADFRSGLAEGFRFLAANEGPYLVHCTEGKDRAGFVSAVLESLMGASGDEVIADYMTTYYNYYGITPEDPRYAVIANSNVCSSLAQAFGVADIRSADLAPAAENYLYGLGLSPDEVAALKNRLAGTAEPEEVTTEAEIVTTEAEEVTTEAEEITTEAEEVTTEAEEVTTEAEEITTEAEEVTTEAEEITTEAEEVTTEAEEVTTEDEEITTEAEVVTTEEETELPATAEPETEEPATEEESEAPAPESTTAEEPAETTAEQTTAESTTAEATTAEATTAAPTTAEPTTAAPTTAEPTTAAPTTAEPTTAAPAEAPVVNKLPAVGERVFGFRAKEQRTFPLIGATATLFEHEKTGAELLYIANKDTNRVFDLTFFTRAIDNTGLPHVFEHATLDGSEKYPSKALFFNLSYQTYNTFMNAMTNQDMTTYPVASLSEAQLLKYADYYTDSCFNPMIMKDESIYREEAWRYRLASADDDLTMEGTVYSEMLGAYTLARDASYNNKRTALPGSYAANVSGGHPDSIPDMTYESLKNYHDLYYHPSNCIAYLYGDFDNYKDFVKLLDTEFSKYEKREFTFDEPDYTPITGPVEAEYAYGIEEGSNTERGSEIYYSIVMPGLNANKADENVINTLTDILGAESSPLMQALKKALPSAACECYIELEGPEDLLVVHAAQVDPGDAATLKETVDAVYADIAENGIAQNLVEGIASNIELSFLLTTESSSVGTDIIPSVAYYYSTTGEPFFYLDYAEALQKLEEWNKSGRYMEALKKYVIGNNLTALSTTYPQPGLKEEKDAALAEKLAAVKESLSEEELQALIDQSGAAEEADDSSAYVKQLQAVTVASLPEEVRSYNVADAVGPDGIRRVSAEAGVDGVGQTIIFLDAAGLPVEDILWFHLYTDLIGQMDTGKHTAEEVAALLVRYFYGGEIRLSLMGEDEDYHPYLRIGFTGMDEDLAAGYDLAYELLYETDYSDHEKLLSLVQQLKSTNKRDITNNIYNIQLYRAFSVDSPLYRYYNYYNFLDYYSFLEGVEQLCTESPELAEQKLTEIAETFRNRKNAITAFAGNKKSIAANQPLADAFLNKLDERDITPVAYDLPVPAKREGIIVDSAVAYNALVADFDSLGVEYSAGLDAVTSFVADKWLYPLLRDQYGAYGAMHGALSDGGIYMLSYRDPNVQQTFDVYDSLPENIAAAKPDQASLDGYILSSYSGYALSEGELSGAVDAILGILNKEDPGLTKEYMKELKGVTPETFAASAALYEKLCENGVRSTAAGAAMINANADLYDVILNPFGTADASEVELTDVPEDSEYYEAVRAVFEEGLMSPAYENAFGVEDPATLGDLAAALYVMVGGEQDAPEDGVAFLAQYGIVAESATASDELSDALCAETIANFTTALGAQPAEAEAPEEKVLNRGELAVRIKAFEDYLETLE